MKVRKEVSYNVSYTLTGKVFLVGIKEINSFVRFDSKYIDMLKAFIEKYKIENINEDALDEQERLLCHNLNQLGYLDNGVPPKESFNEFKKIGKLFFSIRPRSQGGDKWGSTPLGMTVFFLSIVLMLGFMIGNRDFFPQKIDYIHMKIWEIIFTLSVFPVAVLAVHELGHCIIAKYVGVRVDNVSLGWFFIYPIVLVQYFGINLENQRKRLMVMAGGVYFNLIMAFIGMLLKMLFPEIVHGAVIDIWISANISTIITNLGLFGMTDGYFIVTMLVGIMDLRLKGYKYLNALIRKKNVRFGNDYKTCGLVLLVLFVSGFVSTYINLNYWLGLFQLTGIIFYVIFSSIIVFLSGKFLLRIKNVFA